MRTAAAVGVVVLVAAGMFLVRPPWEQLSLREADEVWFLTTALGMAEGREAWLWPNLADPGMDKPPGFLALIAASFRVFGVSVAAGRLPSSVMMVLAALLTALAGRRAAGPMGALLAGLALLTPPFLYAPRGAWNAVTEPALVAAMAAALWITLRIAEPRGLPDRSRAWGLALGVVLGWMTLLKTLIVLLPCAALVGSLLVVGRDSRHRLLRAAPLTAAALLVTAGAWPVVLLAAGKEEYLSGIWLAGGIAKIGAVVGGGRREPGYLLTYAGSGLGSLLPVALAATALALLPGRSESRAARRLALTFLLTNLVLFSVTATQWPWYAHPALPALALLVAAAFHDAARAEGGLAAAVLASSVAVGLLVQQPWVRALDLMHPEVGLLEIPFLPEPAHLLAQQPVLGGLLGLALPVAVLVGWRRLPEGARAGVATTMLLAVSATSLANLARIQWVPEHRPVEPLLGLVDLALAKEARGGEEDWGLNEAYFRFYDAVYESARPNEPTLVTIVARDPTETSPLRLEWARPVPPRDERRDFPDKSFERLGPREHRVELDTRLGPYEPLLLRLRRDDTAGPGNLESRDCLRVFHLGGAKEVTLNLTVGQLRPTNLPRGVTSEVFCGAARPHYEPQPRWTEHPWRR